MDSFSGMFNKFAGGQGGQNNQQQQHNQQNQQYQQQQPQQGNAGGFLGQGNSGGFMGQGNAGGFLGGLTNKVNAAAGGGPESEKNEDYLDKAVDFAQERFLGQGKQDNESAVEQAKDEQISDFIRNKYKTTTGKDFFIKDKPTAFDRTAD